MSRRQLSVVGAMIEDVEGRYLITQRRAEATLPLLWEFPGGRVEEGESHAQALVRELKELLDVVGEVDEQVLHTRHEYPDYDIDFRVFRARLKGPPEAIRHLRVNDHRWVTLEQMSQYKFPDADARTLERLLDLKA